MVAAIGSNGCFKCEVESFFDAAGVRKGRVFLNKRFKPVTIKNETQYKAAQLLARFLQKDEDKIISASTEEIVPLLIEKFKGNNELMLHSMLLVDGDLEVLPEPLNEVVRACADTVTELDVPYCELTAGTLNACMKLFTKAEKLVLRTYRTIIANGFLREIDPYPQLKILHISSDRFIDDGMEHLQRHRGLQHLSIDGPFGEGGVSHLVALPSLKQLVIGEGSLPKNGLGRLQELLPKVEIVISPGADKGQMSFE